MCVGVCIACDDFEKVIWLHWRNLGRLEERVTALKGHCRGLQDFLNSSLLGLLQLKRYALVLIMKTELHTDIHQLITDKDVSQTD